MSSASSPSPSGCQRHRLTVDFDAIGWGDWIINPQRFDAYYCAGACAFPLNKVSRKQDGGSESHSVGVLNAIKKAEVVQESHYTDEAKDEIITSVKMYHEFYPVVSFEGDKHASFDEYASNLRSKYASNLPISRAPLGGLFRAPPLVFLGYLLNQCRYHHQTCSTLSPNNFTHCVKILKSRVL